MTSQLRRIYVDAPYDIASTSVKRHFRGMWVNTRTETTATVTIVLLQTTVLRFELFPYTLSNHIGSSLLLLFNDIAVYCFFFSFSLRLYGLRDVKSSQFNCSAELEHTDHPLE